MQINSCLGITVATIASFALLGLIGSSNAAEDNYSVGSGYQDSTIKQPITPPQKEKEPPPKTDPYKPTDSSPPGYDVKKPSDPPSRPTEGSTFNKDQSTQKK